MLLPVVLVWVGAACSPTFNWREVALIDSGVTALLPCKADHGARAVPLAGKATELHMMGCTAGGQTYTVAVADTGNPASAALALTQWRAATLASLQVQANTPPTAIEGSVTVQGRQADGQAVAAQVRWFIRQGRVFQAMALAPRLDPGQAETFFAGIKPAHP
ncbi:MAG: hypothetical protein RLZZ401_2166 [Pseudomonadota bacterium]|jgi:hypothetical protein